MHGGTHFIKMAKPCKRLTPHKPQKSGYALQLKKRIASTASVTTLTKPTATAEGLKKKKAYKYPLKQKRAYRGILRRLRGYSNKQEREGNYKAMKQTDIIQGLKNINPNMTETELQKIAEYIEAKAQEDVNFLFSLSKVRDIMKNGNEAEVEELHGFIAENGIEKAIKKYGTAAELAPREAEKARKRIEAEKKAEEDYKKAFDDYITAHADYYEMLKRHIKDMQKGSPENQKYINSILTILENEELKKRANNDTELQDLIEKYNALLSELITSFCPQDSGNNFINQSGATKALVNRETGEIYLGTNPDSGEAAIMQLISGYITPYEKELLECVSKFKYDGQITESGKIWFTLGQLYRALRHGAGTTSPQNEQKEALLKALTELERPERKIAFKLNDYLKVWGGFETNGGRLRIIGFDELYGKIRGQEDILIILDNTPFICAIAENLKMYELIGQEVKAIKETRYTLTLKEPIQINGKTVKKRSFKSNAERIAFCQKNGITSENIAAHAEMVKPFALSENRIALRAVILDFVYRYIRARAVNRQYSNKLPYTLIYERCNIDVNSREATKRARADIAVILNHLVNCDSLQELKAWSEYTNKHSKKADGIQIFLQLPELPESEA